jgi:dihydropteroate synthase
VAQPPPGAPAGQSRVKDREFRVMGVLNVTPDSFSDGGSYLTADAALEHGERLLGEGADIVDVGGESTRPGAEPVSTEEELARVLLDPGIGFGKTAEHNLELLRRLRELLELGRPLVIGTSRKSFLGRIAARAHGLDEPLAPEARLAATLASNVLAFEHGASVFRVHDVAPVREALAVAAATLGSRWTPRIDQATLTS